MNLPDALKGVKGLRAGSPREGVWPLVPWPSGGRFIEGEPQKRPCRPGGSGASAQRRHEGKLSGQTDRCGLVQEGCAGSPQVEPRRSRSLGVIWPTSGPFRSPRDNRWRTLGRAQPPSSTRASPTRRRSTTCLTLLPDRRIPEKTLHRRPSPPLSGSDLRRSGRWTREAPNRAARHSPAQAGGWGRSPLPARPRPGQGRQDQALCPGPPGAARGQGDAGAAGPAAPVPGSGEGGAKAGVPLRCPLKVNQGELRRGLGGLQLRRGGFPRAEAVWTWARWRGVKRGLPAYGPAGRACPGAAGAADCERAGGAGGTGAVQRTVATALRLAGGGWMQALGSLPSLEVETGLGRASHREDPAMRRVGARLAPPARAPAHASGQWRECGPGGLRFPHRCSTPCLCGQRSSAQRRDVLTGGPLPAKLNFACGGD
jgi:hypothetical protein